MEADENGNFIKYWLVAIAPLTFLLGIGSVYMYYIIHRIYSVYYSRDAPALQAFKMMARPILHLCVFFFVMGYTVAYWIYVSVNEGKFTDSGEDLVQCWLVNANSDLIAHCGETPSLRPNEYASLGVTLLPVTQTLLFIMIFSTTGRFTGRCKQALSTLKENLLLIFPTKMFFGEKNKTYVCISVIAFPIDAHDSMF